MAGNALTCRCGCGRAAQYLVSGTGYHPDVTRRRRFVDDPVCSMAMEYLRDAADELADSGIPPLIVKEVPHAE
jgi:hypothetical protein